MGTPRRRLLCAVALTFILHAAHAQRESGISPETVQAMRFSFAPSADLHVAGASAVATETQTTAKLAALPEDPSAMPATAASGVEEAQAVAYERTPVAPLLEKYIRPGWIAQPLNVEAKVRLGVRDLYRPGSILAIFTSASFTQWRNGSPNYGTDAGAYGQRLAAIALRDTSGNLLVDSVFAPLLHEDPRYYIEGPQHNAAARTLYAITRPLITRTDAGGHTLNGAMLLGNAVASVASGAYYPQANRNYHDIASTYGTSVGGAALGFFVDEFIDDFFKALHLEKR